MELLPHEFITVVMSNSVRVGIMAEPAEIKLFCTAARVGCGDCREFEPMCGGIYHHEDAQLELRPFSCYVRFYMYFPRSCTLYVYLLKWVFIA